MAKKQPPTHVTLDGGQHGGNIAACCDYDGARFHIWLDPHTLAPTGSLVWKNSLPGQPRFETRKLSQDKGVGKLIADHLVAGAPVAFPVWLEEVEAARKAMEEKHAAAQRAMKIRDAAPEMYAALEQVRSYLRSSRFDVGMRDGYAHIIENALAKVDA